MSSTVIKIENLSKQYRLGVHQGYKTFRDTIAGLAKAPFQKVRNSLTGNNNKANQTKKAEFIWALKEVSLDVNQGEVVGIIGRNGAGKSTLLKILSKITEPTEGRVEYCGRVGLVKG